MNRRLRVWSLAVPLSVVACWGLLVACGDDDSGPGTFTGLDGSPDGQNNADTGSPDVRADVITPIDGGADVQPTPLCITYPDIDVDAGAGMTTTKRYFQIAYNAVGDTFTDKCELQVALDPDGNYFNAPDPIPCLGLQLQALTGCQGGAGAIQYTSTTNDPITTSALCAPDSGTDPFNWLGFKLDPSTSGPPYVKLDVDLMIAQIRRAAIGLGYSVPDADRLVALLHAQKGRIATADAGADGGYSNSACEP